MKHPGNATLFDHWLSIRHGRMVPDRNDLDPVAIRSVLAFTFMIEVDGSRPSARRYPVRVSGTRLDALFGRSVKGESFAAFWTGASAGELRAIVDSVVEDGTPAVVGAVAAPLGFEPVPIELLILPLRSPDRSSARLICSLAPLAMPTWLGLRGVAPLKLSTWRIIDPADAPNGAAARTSSGVSSVSTPDTRRRLFTVVQGGRVTEPSRFGPPSQAHVKPAVSGSDTVILSFQAP